MQLLTKLSNFQQRALLGLFSIFITIGAITLSHRSPYEPLFPALLLFVHGMALWEFYEIGERKGFHSLSYTAIIFSSLYMSFHFIGILYPELQFLSLTTLFLFAIVCFTHLFKRQEGAIATLAITALGLLYITFPLSLLLDINFLKEPITLNTTAIWIFFLLTTTKITDMFAYFAGKKWGRTPFAPAISPKKTVEGAIAGLVGATITAMLFHPFISSLLTIDNTPSFLEMSLLGLTIGVFAEFGDLAESVIKRDAKVKDSNAIPGFGGILDLVDSTIFTTPVLYAYLMAKALV